jgi:hypothetical protein
MAISDADIDLAVSVTGTFENSGDPYVGVTGDFDGMGISCGVLQWNIGSNSLQPLVRLAGEAAVLANMPVKGAEMWTACISPLPAGLKMVRAWQTDGVLSPAIAAELRAFMGSPEMRAVQKRRIAAIAQSADALAAGWAHNLGRADRSAQEFVWFFDVLTQNGGMKNVGYSDVEAFLVSAPGGGAVSAICDWLAAVPAGSWGQADCVKNAGLWRGTVPAESLDLFVLSYLRACQSRPPARGLVMNRKGTLATKMGYVNTERFNLAGKI